MFSLRNNQSLFPAFLLVVQSRRRSHTSLVQGGTNWREGGPHYQNRTDYLRLFRPSCCHQTHPVGEKKRKVRLGGRWVSYYLSSCQDKPSHCNAIAFYTRSHQSYTSGGDRGQTCKGVLVLVCFQDSCRRQLSASSSNELTIVAEYAFRK